LWFNRPVVKKVLFGLFGEREQLDVVDRGPFSFEKASEVLALFVNEKLEDVESRMR
jgi:hypothetical protein